MGSWRAADKVCSRCGWDMPALQVCWIPHTPSKASFLLFWPLCSPTNHPRPPLSSLTIWLGHVFIFCSNFPSMLQSCQILIHFWGSEMHMGSFQSTCTQKLGLLSAGKHVSVTSLHTEGPPTGEVTHGESLLRGLWFQPAGHPSGSDGFPCWCQGIPTRTTPGLLSGMFTATSGEQAASPPLLPFIF